MNIRTRIYDSLQKLYEQRANIISFSKFSSVQSLIQTSSTFSDNDDFKLPLKINGRLVTAGTYEDDQFGEIIMEPDELRSVMSQWEGVGIYTDHGVFRAINKNEDISVRNIIGKITKTVWNEQEKGIDFFAEIVDEDIARKIFNGLIQFISIGFGRTPEFVDDKVFLRNIRPHETSLVFNPRDKKAAFMPVVG